MIVRIEKEKVFAYPLGVGNLMMSGCFGSGYEKGDPCYENLRFTTRCAKQIDSANFIGVGYDITKTYSADSRYDFDYFRPLCTERFTIV